MIFLCPQCGGAHRATRGRLSLVDGTLTIRLGCPPRHRRRRLWTAAEERELAERYPDTLTKELAEAFGRTLRQVYAKAAAMGLSKDEEYLRLHCRIQPGQRIGREYEFKPGHVPANKGLRRPGYAPGRMAETQFKPGQRPPNWRPVGTVLPDSDGYLRKKVSDDAPYQWDRWPYLHHLVWEEENGPVPEGHKLVFRNGDQSDVRLENLELLTDAELLARQSIHTLPKPLAEVIQLRGALVRRIRRQEREQQEAAG